MGNALKTLARKFTPRVAHPQEFVRRRFASEADRLNREGRDAARVEIVNEALGRVTELAYILDAGHLVNVDYVTGRLLIPAPWGERGWMHYGLRAWEARRMRRILRHRQDIHERTGKGRAPLFYFDAAELSWYLDIKTYPSLSAAGWYVGRSPITLTEWRKAEKKGV